MIKKIFKKTVLLNLAILIGNNMYVQAKLLLKSTDFENQANIPRKFTCQGENKSPNLSWANTPTNTKSIALLVEDPDAPQAEPFVHWIIYNIPANKTKLDQAISKEKIINLTNLTKSANSKEEIQMAQGINSLKKIGYDGPCPPAGKAHRYIFKLYALDKDLELKPSLNKKEFLAAIKNSIIDSTELIGLYKRE